MGMCGAGEVGSGGSRDPIRVVPSSQDPKILKNEVLSDQGSSTVKCSVYTDFRISEIYVYHCSTDRNLE